MTGAGASLRPIGELHGNQIFLYSGVVLSVRADHHVALLSMQDAVLNGDRLTLTNQRNMTPYIETSIAVGPRR